MVFLDISNFLDFYKNLKKNNNIILTGSTFRLVTGHYGSGKTFLGEYISRELNKKFIDTDQEIKNIYKKNISEIFNLFGEKYFRYIENKTCKKICNIKNSVISTGGGTLLYKKNLDLFINKNLIIFLDTPFEICYKRILNTDRPLVLTLSKSEMKYLYNLRKQKYLDISSVIIKIN